MQKICFDRWRGIEAAGTTGDFGLSDEFANIYFGELSGEFLNFFYKHISFHRPPDNQWRIQNVQCFEKHSVTMEKTIFGNSIRQHFCCACCPLW